MAGRSNHAKGIGGLAGEDQVDGVQYGSDGAKSDIVSVVTQAGVAGGEFAEAILDFVARGPDVLAGMAEGDLLFGSGPRGERSELERSESFDHRVEARRRLGVAGSGVMAFGDGVGQECRHSLYS